MLNLVQAYLCKVGAQVRLREEQVSVWPFVLGVIIGWSEVNAAKGSL